MHVDAHDDRHRPVRAQDCRHTGYPAGVRDASGWRTRRHAAGAADGLLLDVAHRLGQDCIVRYAIFPGHSHRAGWLAARLHSAQRLGCAHGRRPGRSLLHRICGSGALIGAAGRAFLPPLADADLAFAEIAKVVLPIGLRGLVLAASLAAIMSTATACLLATSTVFLEDVYLTLKKSGGTGSVAQSRALTLILGVLAAVVACVMHDVVAALTVGYDLLVGAIFVPIIAAMVFERGAPAAAFISIIVSAILVIVLMFVKGINSVVPIYGGLTVGLVLFLGLSSRPIAAALSRRDLTKSTAGQHGSIGEGTRTACGHSERRAPAGHVPMKDHDRMPRTRE